MKDFTLHFRIIKKVTYFSFKITYYFLLHMTVTHTLQSVTHVYVNFIQYIIDQPFSGSGYGKWWIIGLEYSYNKKHRHINHFKYLKCAHAHFFIWCTCDATLSVFIIILCCSHLIGTKCWETVWCSYQMSCIMHSIAPNCNSAIGAPPPNNKCEHPLYPDGREQKLAFNRKLSRHCNCNPAYCCLLLKFIWNRAHYSLSIIHF